MTVALLLDEMIGPKVANALRSKGIDVYGAVEKPDLRSLPDSDVLALATTQGRVLVTFNIQDFTRLDQQWRSAGRGHAGIVMVPAAAFRQDRGLIGLLVRSLVAAVSDMSWPGADQVSYLEPSGTRNE